MGMLLFSLATLTGVALVFATGSPQPGMAGYESRDVSLGTIAIVCLGSIAIVCLGSIAVMLLATWLALTMGGVS